MTLIEENTEMIDLWQKTLEVENRQKKRMVDMSSLKEKEKEMEKEAELLQGNSSSHYALEQEESQRKTLVDDMIHKSNSNIGSVVKVLAHTQSNFHIIIFSEANS